MSLRIIAVELRRKFVSQVEDHVFFLFFFSDIHHLFQPTRSVSFHHPENVHRLRVHMCAHVYTHLTFGFGYQCLDKDAETKTIRTLSFIHVLNRIDMSRDHAIVWIREATHIQLCCEKN